MIERSPLKRNKVPTKTNSKEDMVPDYNDKSVAPKLSIKFKINTKNKSNKRYTIYFLHEWIKTYEYSFRKIRSKLKFYQKIMINNFI